DEGTALEVLAAEPLVEQVEDAEQVLFGSLAAPAGLRFDPAKGPTVLTLLQERKHEIVLGREVVVQGPLGDAGPVDYLVDAHVADPPCREELIGGFEQPLAWMRLNRQVCPALPVRGGGQAARGRG